MTPNQFDPELQAIEQKLLTAPLAETLEIDSCESVHIPRRRKRSLLTRVRRQYDRLDDKFQQPLVAFGGVVGSKYTRVFLTAAVGGLLVWYTASSGNPNTTLGSFPKPNTLPGIDSVKVVTTEITSIDTSSRSSGWSKYTPATKTEYVTETISLP